MSMRDYAVNDYGLLMTDEALKFVASKAIDWYTEAEYDENYMDYWSALYENGIVEYISDFTGESMQITDDGRSRWDSGETYNCDYVYYVPASNYSTLFKAAYEDINELVSEFKEKLGEYLPDDFDYRGHIRHIVGTYFG